jgi:SAM-dependent methyltransferase
LADEGYHHPRLAAIYDALDPDRSDLEAYIALIEELGGRRVIDLGCGTGTLSLLLADRGYDVVGVDPAAASVAVARVKPGADRVRWIDGDARSLTTDDRDLAVLTGNVVQAISDPRDWEATLLGVRRALRPGGHLVFETRRPEARAWEGWTRESTFMRVDIPGVGRVTTWLDVTSIAWPLVTFQGTCEFAADGAILTSTSTLRFREQNEVEADLARAGYSVIDVRDAPDRSGLELVFVAQVPSTGFPH